MPNLTFIPLSLLSDNAPDVERITRQQSPMVFGREAIFVDAEDTTARLPAERRELRSDLVLAAVVQKGRLFQRAFPEVTVLRDRGRFLLVEVDPNHPALTRRTEEPCYAAYRVEPGTEIFRERATGELRVARDPSVETVLAALSVKTFRTALEELVALPTRLSTSAFYRQAAELCKSRLEAFGYSVSLQAFNMPGGGSCNVVAVPAGSKSVDVLVTGHLDSVNRRDGPTGKAPGADDNGSGSAGVIAMAEALASIKDRLAVGFILFGGEEQYFLGSQHFLSRLPGEARAVLRAIVNMDMIGTLNTQPDGTPVPPGVLLEGAEVSRHVIEGLAAQAATWTDLAVQTSLRPFASDHVPFIEAGLPGVLTIEGADQANNEIHGPNDTLDRINDGLAYRILRMNTAYVASLAMSKASAIATGECQP